MDKDEYVIVVYRQGDKWYYVGERGFDGEYLPEDSRFSSCIHDAKVFSNPKAADCAIVTKDPYKVTLLRRCPKCRQPYADYPAISRDDNKTEICPRCGMAEALRKFNEHLEGK